MFTITSTRIVGLIAVVCAAIVAPQAVAMPKLVAPPDVEARQEQSNAPAAAGQHKSVTAGSTAAAIKALQRRSLALDAAYRKLYPGAYRQVQKSNTAALWKFPACGPSAAAEYEYIYSGDPCTWTEPATTIGTTVLAAMFGYLPTNPGWGATATEAKKSAAKTAVKTAPVVCNGQAEYDYIYSGCDG